MQGGAVHARRQAGTALSRGARRAWPSSDTRRPCLISPQVAAPRDGETGLLPHVNPGLLDAGDIAALRKVSISQGIMLESAAERLCERGGPHFGSPDKGPPRASRPSGSQAKRRSIHDRHSDRHRRDTRRTHRGAARAARPQRSLRPHSGNHHSEFPAEARHAHGAMRPRHRSTSICWTIAIARLLFEPAMNIQAPPNLSPGIARAARRRRHQRLGRRVAGHARSRQSGSAVAASGSVSHARRSGRQGTRRAPRDLSGLRADRWMRWVDPALRTALLHRVDSDGFPRTDGWSPGHHGYDCLRPILR